jgi:hypothetical protein
MNFYETVLDSFNTSNVEYLVVGGIAVTLYGADRTTKDLDIWIDNSSGNIEHLRNAFTELKFSKKGIQEALKRLAEGETIIVPDKTGEYFRIDLIALYTSIISFADAYLKKTIFTIGQTTCSVISLDLLIESKIRAGRDKDLLDAKNLRMIRNKDHN